MSIWRPRNIEKPCELSCYVGGKYVVHTQNAVHQVLVVEDGDAYSLISIYVRHSHLLVLYVQEEFLVNFDS